MNAQPTIGRPPIVVTILVVAAVLASIVGGVLLALNWTPFVDAVRSGLGPPLHRLHSPLDRLLASLPMWSAQVSAMILFLLGVVFAWCLPRSFVYLGAPDQARWRDLRIWATAVLIPYMVIYLVLGR